MPDFASGARTELSYVKETTFGTTPSGPSMQLVPTTGNTLNKTKTQLQSNTIRSDRMIEDHRHGFNSVVGSIPVELAHGNHDDFLEWALFSDPWAANVLKAGTTEVSFSVEKRFTDVTRYHQFTGCEIARFSLSAVPDSMVTASFDILGKDMAVSGTSLDASPTAAADKDPFDSFSGSLQEGGSSIATLTAFEFTLENNLGAAQVLGATTTPDIFSGRSNLTGRITAYFEDDTLLSKFLDETESSLQIVLSDPASNTLTIDVPRIKYTGGDVPVSGEGPILVTLPWQGLYDSSTELTNLKITRSA